MKTTQITLNPSAIARVLGAVASLLVLASTGLQLTIYLTVHARVFGLVRLFYVNAESNIPTIFSTLLLLFATLLLAVITISERKEISSSVWHWALLSFGFLCMGVDEGWSFHEELNTPIRLMLGDGNLGVFYYAWVLPGITLVLVLGLCFLRFSLRLPPKTRLTFLMAATLYIGGAIGFELIGARFAELHGKRNLTYSMITTVEESLEMAGVIIFIWALLAYIADKYKEVCFRFSEVRGDVTNEGP